MSIDFSPSEELKKELSPSERAEKAAVLVEHLKNWDEEKIREAYALDRRIILIAKNAVKKDVELRDRLSNFLKKLDEQQDKQPDTMATAPQSPTPETQPAIPPAPEPPAPPAPEAPPVATPTPETKKDADEEITVSNRTPDKEPDDEVTVLDRTKLDGEKEEITITDRTEPAVPIVEPAAEPAVEPAAPVVEPAVEPQPTPEAAPLPPAAAPASSAPPAPPVVPPAPENPPTPPTATPEAAPPTEPEAPQKKEGFFATTWRRFKAKFRGEVTEEQKEGYKVTWGDLGKGIVVGGVTLAARLYGIKLASDLTQWGMQSYFTNPAERKRILGALVEKEKELGEQKGDEVLNKKKTELEKAVNESKFLTKKQKEALISKLNDEVATYEKEDTAKREERNQRIKNILENTIQTRMTGKMVMKETVNSALAISGLATIRALTLGSMKLGERAARVKMEIAKGERSGGFLKEWLWKGLTETAHKLSGGGADYWAGRGLNFVQGASNVAFGLGIGYAAYGEIMDEGAMQGAIESSLKALEEKGALHAAAGHMHEPVGRIMEKLGVEDADSTNVTQLPDAGVAHETVDISHTVGTPDAGGSAHGAEITAGIATPEVSLSDFPTSQVELATVVKGDGILEVLERQLEASPTSFGYTGDLTDTHAIDAWAKATALDEARSIGVVRLGGDTRLSSEAIGRLAIIAKATPDHGIDLGYFDKTTGQELYLADARAQDLFYEHGSAPGEIPTQHEVARAADATPLAPPPPLEATTGDIPESFAQGAVRLFIDDGKINGVQIGEVSPDNQLLVARMLDADAAASVGADGLNTAKDVFLLNVAIKELEEAGQGGSAQASYLREQLTAILNASGGMLDADNEIVKSAAEEAGVWLVSTVVLNNGVDVSLDNGGDPEAQNTQDETQDTEPMRRFFGHSGKVKFLYDRDGNVHDAFIPTYIPKPANIDSSLSEWGFTRNELVDHFLHKRGQWEPMVGGAPVEQDVAPYVTSDESVLDVSARGEYGRFIQRIERLARQEATLNEMETRGLAGTPEYEYWKDETDTFRKFVEDRVVKKEFPAWKKD